MSEKVIRQDKTVKVARKNCDKFITPTVRVRFSLQFFKSWSKVVFTFLNKTKVECN